MNLRNNPWSRKERHMLWTVAMVVLVLWALGLVSGTTLGGFIHVLLLLAIIVVLLQIIQGGKINIGPKK